jgi:hypothetical protein
MNNAPYGKTSGEITQYIIISYCHPQVNKQVGGFFSKMWNHYGGIEDNNSKN